MADVHSCISQRDSLPVNGNDHRPLQLSQANRKPLDSVSKRCFVFAYRSFCSLFPIVQCLKVLASPSNSTFFSENPPRPLRGRRGGAASRARFRGSAAAGGFQIRRFQITDSPIKRAVRRCYQRRRSAHSGRARRPHRRTKRSPDHRPATAATTNNRLCH